ncbi:hypothetical protein TIFTF001_011716 [Ficus carica]|uniref:Uncharacterized protein n=1 Tax=Ficus carica TaxID=3494 RepID=A0AA88A152_FICCA|nr:hypothetical protein TIFTF001_011716 [Ficus carica]
MLCFRATITKKTKSANEESHQRAFTKKIYQLPDFAVREEAAQENSYSGTLEFAFFTIPYFRSKLQRSLPRGFGRNLERESEERERERENYSEEGRQRVSFE